MEIRHTGGNSLPGVLAVYFGRTHNADGSAVVMPQAFKIESIKDVSIEEGGKLVTYQGKGNTPVVGFDGGRAPKITINGEGSTAFMDALLQAVNSTTVQYGRARGSWRERTPLFVPQTASAAPTGVASVSGGALSAGNHYAVVVAYNSSNQPICRSAESLAVATTGTASSIAWTWAAVAGATTYRLFVGTATGVYPANSGQIFGTTYSQVVDLPVSGLTIPTLTANTINLMAIPGVPAGATFDTLDSISSFTEGGKVYEVVTTAPAKDQVQVSGAGVLTFSTLDQGVGINVDFGFSYSVVDAISYDDQVNETGGKPRFSLKIVTQGSSAEAVTVYEYPCVYVSNHNNKLVKQAVHTFTLTLEAVAFAGNKLRTVSTLPAPFYG